jgi:hypothetical protein
MLAFQEAVQSLKLYRRADLQDPESGTSLVQQLYVDPLPAEHVLQTALQPHTTYIIGRKGTGKSTIFQRLQAELRKSKHQTSAYVDIKTVYEDAQVDPHLLARIQNLDAALPSQTLERILLYKAFLKAVILEVKDELRKRVEGSLWESLKERVTGSLAELFGGLDELIEDADEDRFISVLGVHGVEQRTKDNASQQDTRKLSAGLELGDKPKVTAQYEGSSQLATAQEAEAKLTDILMRSFDMAEFIRRLQDVLQTLGVRNLYVLLDDFSELPQPAMQVVVDVLLAPLNNRSQEFIKFKIAAYPGRIYYGAIDKSKVDEIYLDIYRLYGGGDVGKMEDSAIDFTRRLVESRVRHFCKLDASEFVDGTDDQVWRHLFYASMANPRSLGYILHYLYESSLIRGKRIGVSAIQEAGERYYDEKIEPYFAIGKFLHESFEERSSIYSLKELLEALVARARELRSHDSEVIRKIHGRPPTSHFHVPVAYEPLFSTLELNFFVTKYFEMTDRSARKVAVYALNYGLCSKYTIRFGRPVGEREFRLYFVERIFDYSSLVLSYLASNQEISCKACGERFSHDQLDALKLYGMACPRCRQGTVAVTNLSRKYAHEINAVNREQLLPATELGILQTLHVERGPLRAGEIAGELDVSYQLVGKRGKALADRGLVSRPKVERGSPPFAITQMAETAYFSDPTGDDLQLPTDEPPGDARK